MDEKRTERYSVRIAVPQSVAWSERKVRGGCWDGMTGEREGNDDDVDMNWSPPKSPF